MKLSIIILSIITIIFTGCGTDQTDISNVKVNANVTDNTAFNDNSNAVKPAETAEGGVLVLSGSGKSENYTCNGREVEVEESTTANKFILTGECKKLTVDGVSNKVYVDRVGEIVVSGTSNKVYYGEGPDGGKPKITKNGTSLIVEQTDKAGSTDGKSKE